MKCLPNCLFSAAILLFLLVSTTTLAATNQLDSLRQLGQWPLATQLRLARTRMAQPGPRVAVAEEVARQQGHRLSPLVYLELLGSLAGYYIHENQPSLALAKLLEVRQSNAADSARRANAAIWLSYCYQMLRQPQTGLAYGREALRYLPRHAANRATELGQAYRVLAGCADLIPDYKLEAHYYQQALTVARRAHDLPRMAVALTYLAEVARHQQRYAQAARLLDSAQAIHDARSYPDLLLMERELAARLALHEGRYQAAEYELAATRSLLGQEPLWEAEVLELLVPALAGQGRYREALASQQRLQKLQATAFEDNANRHAQELQVRYATAQREQELRQQRQRIALLQTQAQLRTAQYSRRLAWLGAAVLAVGLLLTLGLGWWATRQRRLRTEREARLRNRIAADLHNEVGTLLARVSMQADLLHQQQPEPSPALDRLLGNSRAAARTMRDIVWSIDAQADTVGALLDRIRDHLDQTATPAGLLTQLITNGLRNDLPLRPELRQHLYLIFKEAVTNAVRHATHATTLAVTLTRYDVTNALVLTIEDDGTAGLPPARSGRGLRNMQQRAADLRGTLEAGPRREGGFRVQLQAPF